MLAAGNPKFFCRGGNVFGGASLIFCRFFICSMRVCVCVMRMRMRLISAPLMRVYNARVCTPTGAYACTEQEN